MSGNVYRIERGQDGGGPEAGPARRLAAILAADIVGYSRLMGLDEEGTHARIKRQRRELIDPTIAEHHGRLIKNTGDGFLVMFDSPVEAVRCAIVIQQSMVGRNAAVPQSHWILYRIGVNLGDVIVEADDIYGDGVNVAARLETLAEPGTVYISGGIYEQIKNKLVCGYQSLGDQRVKNITDPVSVYRVLPDPGSVKKARRSRNVARIGTFLGFVVVVGLAASYFLIQREPGTAPVAQISTLPSPATPPAQTAAPTEPVAAPAPPARSAAIAEPEMVLLPAGTMMMGGNDDFAERPPHHVAIKSFAIGKYPVTMREWKACVAASACKYAATGDDDAPVTNVSWTDARQYTAWLSQATQKGYRLPSEAEWEYAARAGTTTARWWGDAIGTGKANCNGCGSAWNGTELAPVGSFPPNRFGLHDMLGNVWQWTEDCWNESYAGAPSDGRAWTSGDCSKRVLRGGSWSNVPEFIRSAARSRADAAGRDANYSSYAGFHVARSLP
jgi:formylglycine-generating enzyme required for sulfatase activity/class 3 adenylate cyclase